MKALFAALALFVLAAPVRAQDPAAQTVVLSGWALPEGTSITSSSHVVRRAKVRQFDSPEAMVATSPEPLVELDVFTAHADSVHTSFEAVDEAGPVRVERYVFISDILEDVHQGDQILDRSRHPNPLSGTHYTAERTAEGAWQRRFLRPADPTEAQMSALGELRFDFDSPHYPAHPVAVGGEWNVDADGLVRLFGELEPGHTQRMTFRLDSTGAFVGQPAAFLSYGLEVTTRLDDGVLMTQKEVGIVVRLLDWLVDVYEERQGLFRTMSAGYMEDGQPIFSVMEGEIRGRTLHLLTVPTESVSAGAP
jgi:hypothetical protein